MPIHDWTRVDAGIFHHFHQRWIVAITDALNLGLLPGDYYALTERRGAGFEPDILAPKTGPEPESDVPHRPTPGQAGGGVLMADPRVSVKAETDLEFYRRRQDVATIRHASGDHLVAIVEVISRGNKSGRKALDDLLRKAGECLGHGIHLLILDLPPPTSRDPDGIHGAIWDEVAGQDYARPPDKPLTLAAYESGPAIRAFVEPIAVGDTPIDMPLFLAPGRHVLVPVEATYRQAFNSVPARWRAILEGG